MSGIQNFLRAIMSRSAYASMEAESRAWVMTCPNCQHEQSVWEAGGIRWGAAGNPRRYTKCPKCDESHWKTLVKK